MRRMVTSVLAGVLLTGPAFAQAPAPQPARNVTPPRIVKRVDPVYTPDAMRARAEGVVRLEAIIEPDGLVSTIKVLESAHPTLEAPAMDAVKQWVYDPARVDGKPVRLVARVTVSFTLRGAPPRIEWPDGFTAARTAAPADATWVEDSAVASGLEIGVSYPEGWTVRKYPASTDHVLSVVSNRGWFEVRVLYPRPFPMTFDQPMPVAQLQQFALTVPAAAKAAGRAPVSAPRAVGQVPATHGGYWIWLETATEMARVPQLEPAAAFFDAGHLWVFTGTPGKQMVMVMCSALLPTTLTPEEQQQHLAEARAEFGEIIRRIAIKPAQ